MKRTSIIVFATLALSACNQQDKEKAKLDDIMKIHNKVMANDEILIKNKMKLDTLLQPGRIAGGNDTLRQRSTMRAIEYNITVADNAMERWMKNFQPDQKGKPHDVIMDYYADQQRQIMGIDSVLRVAVSQSSDYLAHYEKLQK